MAELLTGQNGDDISDYLRLQMAENLTQTSLNHHIFFGSINQKRAGLGVTFSRDSSSFSCS
jgi:hypothetical protein